MPKFYGQSLKKDLFIGYLYVSSQGDKDIYTGAAMVTDLRGIPVEFKYVDPIRPSKLEKVLYGNALEAYLKEELILQNLIKSIEKKPEVLICQDPSLIGPARSLLKTYVISIERYAGSPLESRGAFERLPDGESLLLQAEEVGPPIRVHFGFSFQETEIEAVLHILEEAACYMDLLEPFQRIIKALDVVIEES